MQMSVPRDGKRPKLDVVFLTTSVAEFEQAWLAVKAAKIQLHPAATIGQAKSVMIATDAPVLLVAVARGQEWDDAVEMIGRLHPPRALLVAAEAVDEHFWISALEQGAFDVVQMPFEAEELRRIIDNAAFHVSPAVVASGSMNRAKDASAGLR
jgi:hypothetical protein